MNRVLQHIVIVVLLVALLYACDNSNRGANTSSNPVVIEKVAVLLDALKVDDYEQAIKQYPESFFVKLTREGWKQKLKALNEKNGTMQSYELKKTQADTRFSGKFYILEYMVVHEGKKRVNHIITLLAPVEGGEIKLVGHKMTPWVVEEVEYRLDESGSPLIEQKK